MRVLACLALCWLLTAGLAYADPGPSLLWPQWVDFYGYTSTYLGQPVPPGATIAIFDPRGTQCADFTVTTSGQYGLMSCIGDDPDTPEIEGPQPGEALQFKINDRVAKTTVVLIDEAPAPPDTPVTWSHIIWQVSLHVLFDAQVDLQSSTNPSVFGQPVTFTATVSAVPPGADTPSGTVTFKDDVTVLGTADLAGGVASFTTSDLAVGTHAITAEYSGDANFDASAGSLSPDQTVDKAGTTTTVTSSANPSSFGQSVTFTAFVNVNPPGAGTPSGTVLFLDGATTIGNGTLSGGVATFSTAGLAVGTHPITAEYVGNGSFNSSTSAPALQQVVIEADTVIAVTSAPYPSVYGQPVTFTATVTAVPPGAGTPSGTITFKDGTIPLGTVPLSGGVATLTTSALAAGVHSIVAEYSGDGNFNPSSAALVGGHKVVKADTQTAVASSVNPSVYGQPVTFTATVTAVPPGAGTPSGTVTFKDGGAVLGSAGLTGGVATFTTSDLAVGTHVITAEYEGDSNFNASSGSLSPDQVVDKANTRTLITAAVPDPSVVGQPVLVGFRVAAVAPGSGTPTGDVTVDDGAGATCTGTVAVGRCTLTPTAAGLKTLTATYHGDANFNGSADTARHQVDRADTQMELTSSANPSVFGQAVTFTAAVSTVPPGAGTPTGTVVFWDGATQLGSATLAGGVATFSTAALAVGTHPIFAVYGGNADFSPSGAAVAGGQTVNRADTATALTSAPNPSQLGETVTFTATVAVLAPGAGDPSGTVTFKDGTIVLGTAPLSGGVATFATSGLAVGSHAITAEYEGDGEFNGSISPALAQTVGTQTVYGWVFDDVNGDGWRQDSEQAGFAGVWIALEQNGAVVASTQSVGGDGWFVFAGMAPGQYDVRVTLPAIYIPTSPTVVRIEVLLWQNKNVNFGVRIATPTPTATSMTTATPTPTTTPTWTATPTATPTWTATPTATPTWTATPTATSTWTATPTPSPSATATSTATPTPTPSASPTATHTPTVTPSATATTSPTETPTVTLTPTVTATPTITPTATPSQSTIEGFVWEDQDRDGQRDAGEPGIAGLVITLRAGITQRRGINAERTTITDASGHYRFTDVVPGGYVVQAEDPARYWPTTSVSVTVTAALHQTVEVSFGFYRAPVAHYLPVIVR